MPEMTEHRIASLKALLPTVGIARELLGFALLSLQEPSDGQFLAAGIGDTVLGSAEPCVPFHKSVPIGFKKPNRTFHWITGIVRRAGNGR